MLQKTLQRLGIFFLDLLIGAAVIAVLIGVMWLYCFTLSCLGQPAVESPVVPFDFDQVIPTMGQ